ncbi:MAG: hypothetical protein C0601_12750 [Candidatus Muiribacterium halophilum]|uniref:Polysaccharide biosynthesis protein C-terminal domain-containing protein n=1 Tax=Muiribacterium halophilum TaxID=2053465 RepID=A0A2N5ZA10_MUIH1|nr:MAG: hypothetical protein C0601_12750 [Candidatus Muirbacterium halophilum]
MLSFVLEKIKGKSFEELIVYIFSTFIVNFGNFFLIPFYWKKLTPTDYGIIAIVEMMGVFFPILGGLSLSSAITRFYYEWPNEEKKENTGSLWILNWFSIISIGVIFIFIIKLIFPFLFNRFEFSNMIFLGLVGMLLNSLGEFVFMTIRINRQPKIYFIFNLMKFLLNIGFGLYFVVFLNQKLRGYFLASVFTGLFFSVACILIMLKLSKPCIRSKVIKKSLDFSLPIVPSNIMGTLYSMIDKYILQNYVSLELFGIYSLSLKFVNLIGSLHNAIKLSYAPRIMKIDSKFKREMASKKIAQINFQYIMLIFLGGLFVSLFTEKVVFLIGNEKYFPVIKYVPVLVAVFVLKYIYAYFASGIILSKKTKVFWKLTGVNLILLVILSFLLIPKYQLNGIIMSKFILFLFNLILSSYVSFKLYKIHNKIFLISIMYFVLASILFGSHFINFNFYIDIVLFLLYFLLTIYFIKSSMKKS